MSLANWGVRGLLHQRLPLGGKPLTLNGNKLVLTSLTRIRSSQ
jgi:hypothetical protein